MANDPNGVLQWDIKKIAHALKLRQDDVREYFTDGRRVSFILERRIAREVLKGDVAKSEGAGYDVIDLQGEKWEVRSVSQDGVYFCPSYMVGSGRSFNERGFFEKLDEIEGYILSDIEEFPKVPFWIITKDRVREWYDNGDLGKTTKISRKKFYQLLE
jgi:hypothetical protein